MILEQRPVPPGAPQTAEGLLTPSYVGWIDWVTRALNAFLQGRFYQLVKVTDDYSMKETDSAVIADATAGSLLVTLFDSRLATAKRHTVKKINAGNTVTIVGTIDGAVNLVIATQWQSYDLLPDPDSNAWYLV